jgi:hypothetical protein
MKHVLAFATFLTLVLANPLAQKGTKTVACYCEPPICPLELIAVRSLVAREPHML